VTRRLCQAFDNPRANLVSAYNEQLGEIFVYGTSALAMIQGDTPQNPFSFQARSLMHFYVLRGPNGEDVAFYYDFKLSVEQAVWAYGLDSLSDEVKKQFDAGQLDDKVWFCEAIEPRNLSERTLPDGTLKEGNLGLPLRSITFEVQSGKKVQESGYATWPVYVTRCLTLPNETYGRSYAMDALPAVVQLNAITEMMMLGAELKVFPPLWASNNAIVSGGILDRSPRAINTFDFISAMTQSPVNPIYDVGELQSIFNYYTSVREAVQQHMLIDKLYDFNNTSRMTLGEAELRMMIRGDALTPIYANLEKEWTWAIDRGVNILFGMGVLGVFREDTDRINEMKARGVEPRLIPDEVAKLIYSGEDWYTIEFISPAHRSMRAEELKGTLDMLNVFLAVAQGKQDILDRLDVDELAEQLPQLTGGDALLLRSRESAQVDRDGRAQVAAQRLQVELEKIKAQANQSNAQANASNKNAAAMMQNIAAGGAIIVDGAPMAGADVV
jgi:hypothetical protein